MKIKEGVVDEVEEDDDANDRTTLVGTATDASNKAAAFWNAIQDRNPKHHSRRAAAP